MTIALTYEELAQASAAGQQITELTHAVKGVEADIMRVKNLSPGIAEPHRTLVWIENDIFGQVQVELHLLKSTFEAQITLLHHDLAKLGISYRESVD